MLDIYELEASGDGLLLPASSRGEGLEEEKLEELTGGGRAQQQGGGDRAFASAKRTTTTPSSTSSGCRGIIVSVGGQIPNNLAMDLHRQGVKILGTEPSSIDCAEDRHKFSFLLDSIKVDQPRWSELRTHEEALTFAAEVGYPGTVLFAIL